MNEEAHTEPGSRAMAYICVDLIATMTDIERAARQVAARLGYVYIGMTKSSSLIDPEVLPEHIRTHEVELLIVPDMAHLRGKVPPELAEVTDIHDLATGHTYEREGAYAPDQGHRPNPLATPW
ncbi:hypothetical protein [Nocardia cerradoensis]|uniref:Uncharacterized protein n=1 Tax=Nocardia cerradoensis TaxID=85688 RepID=A0A231GSW3_9NOCA|nr:hypothetical protein [Nocardia cerradoensis]NKY45994.1 hypothetical protein [Nocardia cerradoensis]OXR39713.1 hypothetical protein B7C42_08215 [Nocardia cerradoensis]